MRNCFRNNNIIIFDETFLNTFVNINNQASFVLDFTLFVQLSDPLNKITCEIQKNRYFSSLILFGEREGCNF